MLKFAAIFKDHAVLQREKETCIWGNSDGTTVTVELLDTNGGTVQKTETKVTDGRFEAKLPAMRAGGPFSLKVDDGTDITIINDIYFGEVWLAGGQSNMELELQNSRNGREEVEKSDDKNIRFYYTQKVSFVGKELEEAEEVSCWQLCKPGETAAWSAVGYYFAKKLAAELDVMIGIIGCNWGGTSASCWVDRQSLESDPVLKTYTDSYDEAAAGVDIETFRPVWEEYQTYQAAFDKRVGEYYSTHENPTWAEALKLCGESRYPGPMGPMNFTRPNGLYESMLMRVAPYTLAGFIFYQGEEDDNRAYIYDRLLETLIKVWRRDFRDENLPFILTQLPVFVNEGEEDFMNWPFIREAQSTVASKVPNTYMAVTLELGEFQNIHPTDKKSVGDRLSELALFNVYGRKAGREPFAPEYESHEIKDGKVYIRFAHCPDGLTLSDGAPANTSELGFEIAGDDNVYHKAGVELSPDGGVVLSSPEVKDPAKARYFWKNFAPVYLFGHNGLPLAPFRTDRNDGAVALGSRQGELKE